MHPMVTLLRSRRRNGLNILPTLLSFVIWVMYTCPCVANLPSDLAFNVDSGGDSVLTSPSCSSATTDALVSMSTIVFNEAPYLDEWISYHWSIGVGHFYMYDHGSTDAPQGIVTLLDPYIRRGIVTLHNWSTYVTYNPGPQSRKREPGERPRTSAQNQAYAHSLKNYAERTKFLLFLDVDEFLIVGDEFGKKLGGVDLSPISTSQMSEQSVPSKNPLCLNWLTTSNLDHRYTSTDLRLKWFFVSSDFEERPEGLVLSAYQKRCKDSHPRLAKHMVRTAGRPGTKLGACANPHTCGGKLSKTEVPAAQFYVLHFATKSFTEFLTKPAKKASRGNPRNHSFEFFAKNSCRWSMGKEARQRLARLGSPGFKRCKGDTVKCLQQDLAHTKPTVDISKTTKFYGDVLSHCPPILKEQSRCPSVSFACNRKVAECRVQS